MNPCYKCRHAMAPTFESKFPLWCFHPDRLKAPCVVACDLIETEAGTDEAEQ